MRIGNKTWLGQMLVLYISYTVLAVLLTWPTFSHPASHLPGDGGDDPALAWNLWWIKYALLDQGSNPFQTDYMFYPVGINLAFYTLTVLNALTALPITLNQGVVMASNLHLLFTFATAGYGAFLLARFILVDSGTTVRASKAITENQTWQTRRSVYIWFSAAIAGGFYTFASSKLFYVALGQFNIASSHWIPFTVLYIVRTRREPKRLKNPVMAGLFLTLQAWTEMTYASFILVFAGLYWLCCLLTALLAKGETNAYRTKWTSLASHALAAILMGTIFILGLSPILAQMLPDMLAEGDFLIEGSGFAVDFSADLAGFVIPTMHHPLFGHLITQTGITNFTKGQHIYLGLVLLGLFLVGIPAAYRRPQWRFWLLAALIFAWLCLGPVIFINGYDTGLPGPFSLLQRLPFFRGNRYPSRYSVMLVLSLSPIAALSLLHILHLWHRRRASFLQGLGALGRRTPYLLLGVISLLFLFEHLSTPLPQSNMRIPAPYRIIAAEPAEITVLDIPFAWRNGFRITGPLTPRFMFGQFYQTAHQKKLLQGNTSRNPGFKFQYFTNAPIVNSLLALETGKALPPDRWIADQAIAADVLRFFDIKYIVVRPYRYAAFDGKDSVTVTHRAALAYVETVLPVGKIHDEETIRVYRVKAGEAEPHLYVDTAGPLAPLYFGEGWGLLSPGLAMAAQRQAVRLLIPLTAGSHRISLHLRPPDLPLETPQSLTLALNGWRSPPQRINREQQTYTFLLPANVVNTGLNDLQLRFSDVASLSPLANGAFLMDVTVISAGEEVGGFGYIFVNGYDISLNQRGYNIAVIAPEQGSIRVAGFDTHLDPSASAALVDFISAIPADAVVAVAAADEASANLTGEAVQALQAIGATGDLRGCFRCSHAFIRDKSGAVYEELDRLAPAGVTTNLGLIEPQLAGLLDWIRVEPVEK